jgi:peptidoglycan/LPS O-acetylase OafA/YrhL
MKEPFTNNEYFKPLTGVRAIAAFMVYFSHWNPLSIEHKETFFYNFLNEFHVGVTIFFVLSGFLITNRYFYLKELKLKKYIINRFARIYPAYFILTTATFLYFVLYNTYTWTEGLQVYFLNITFLKGFFHNFKFTGIAQGWSLTVEELFYISAPIFFILLKRSKVFLFILPLFLIFLGIIFVIISSKGHFFGYPTNGFFISYDFMFNYTFFGRCTEFFIGMALAFAHKEGWIKTGYRHFTYMGVMGIILSIFLISILKGDLEFGISHPAGKFINNFLLPFIGISPFFLGLLTETTWISKILGSRIFILLGKSSYIFYLIHYGVFVCFLHEKFQNYVLIFLIINIASILLYVYLEEPLNKFFREKFSNERIS